MNFDTPNVADRTDKENVTTKETSKGTAVLQFQFALKSLKNVGPPLKNQITSKMWTCGTDSKKASEMMAK